MASQATVEEAERVDSQAGVFWPGLEVAERVAWSQPNCKGGLCAKEVEMDWFAPSKSLSRVALASPLQCLGLHFWASAPEV